EGDRFSLPRRDVSKSLKKWMNEAGLDPALRHRLPLLCNGDNVLWIWDHGFCAGVQPDTGTNKLLVIRTDIGDTGGNNNGTAP
ncbi:tRNA lysidine(34) synthetase TilS, partial [Ruminococcaceae bacterium OttesenSCG-928-D13]|nr:tRNA lysidine(34) synthetase TilS [Ruminococcaceae bacterium OttesenSCG-928-D13]